MDKNTSDSQEKQLKKLEEQVNRLEALLYESHMRDIAYHFSNKREVIKINLLAGLSRGIGLTVGTALFLALLFYVVSKVVTIPFIGEYIAELINYIETYREFYPMQ